MRLKKRLLRWLLILFAVGGFTSYFAFSTLFFPPHEGGLESDVSSLVPRDVDFFVAVPNVDRLFDDFPHLAVADRVEALAAWKAFADSPERAELEAATGIAEILKAAREVQDRIPLGLQLPEIFGGSDLACAGYFRGTDLSQADWAVYGHLDFAGKLAIEALDYPGLLGLDAQGLVVKSEGDHVSLSGGQLAREVFVTRILDVGVVATSMSLVQAARDLWAARGVDSFGQSARYYDHVENVPRDPARDEVEVYLDVRRWLEAAGITAPWPDPQSQDFTPNFLGHLFQRGAVQEVSGIVRLDEGVSVRLHGELRSDTLTSLQTRLYRKRGFDRARVFDDIARVAPADCAMFAYLQGDVAELLRQVVDSLGPDSRELLGDAFRNTGHYTSLDEVIQVIADSVHDRLALVVRKNDYPEDPDGPPHDDVPVFAASVVAWTKDGGAEQLVALRDHIGESGSVFGLEGQKPGEIGYYRNYEGGYETREFWNKLVPGTGVIATVNTAANTIVTNQFNMLGHFVKLLDVGGAEWPSLVDRADFRALVGEGLETANVIVWINPQEAAPTLRKQAEFFARDSIQFDWKTIRAQEETKAIRELYPSKRRGQLSPEEQAAVDERVDPVLESIQQRTYAEQVPAVIEAANRRLSYATAASAALLMLSLDPKTFDLSLQVVVPY